MQAAVVTQNRFSSLELDQSDKKEETSQEKDEI